MRLGFGEDSKALSPDPSSALGWSTVQTGPGAAYAAIATSDKCFATYELTRTLVACLAMVLEGVDLRGESGCCLRLLGERRPRILLTRVLLGWAVGHEAFSRFPSCVTAETGRRHVGKDDWVLGARTREAMPLADLKPAQSSTFIPANIGSMSLVRYCVASIAEAPSAKLSSRESLCS